MSATDDTQIIRYALELANEPETVRLVQEALAALDRLAAEIERLRAALRDGMDCLVAYHGEPSPSDDDHCAVCTWLRVAADLAGGVGDTAEAVEYPTILNPEAVGDPNVAPVVQFPPPGDTAA